MKLERSDQITLENLSHQIEKNQTEAERLDKSYDAFLQELKEKYPMTHNPDCFGDVCIRCYNNKSGKCQCGCHATPAAEKRVTPLTPATAVAKIEEDRLTGQELYNLQVARANLAVAKLQMRVCELECDKVSMNVFITHGMSGKDTFLEDGTITREKK